MTEDAVPLKLLLDTNIWLDYFLARSSHHRQVSELITKTSENEHVALYVASLSLKDISYLLASDMKAGARQAGRAITPEVATAARQTAWACTRHVIDHSLVVPVGYDEVLQAFTLRGVHDDFEDDLVLGAAMRAQVDYVVTHDAALAKHAPVPCLDAKEVLGLIRS